MLAGAMVAAAEVALVAVGGSGCSRKESCQCAQEWSQLHPPPHLRSSDDTRKQPSVSRVVPKSVTPANTGTAMA